MQAVCCTKICLAFETKMHFLNKQCQRMQCYDTNVYHQFANVWH